jgi:hypothetical protein
VVKMGLSSGREERESRNGPRSPSLRAVGWSQPGAERRSPGAPAESARVVWVSWWCSGRISSLFSEADRRFVVSDRAGSPQTERIQQTSASSSRLQLPSVQRVAADADSVYIIRNGEHWQTLRPNAAPALEVATPDEVYFGGFPANRRPRFEPRARWPRRSPCATPHALARGRPGTVVELDVAYRSGRRHLPIISLKRAA